MFFLDFRKTNSNDTHGLFATCNEIEFSKLDRGNISFVNLGNIFKFLI